MRTKCAAAFWLALLILAGCSDNYGNPAAPYEAPSAGPLLPASKLSQGIYDWPARPFSETNLAALKIFRDVGDVAIDFTLEDLDRQTHTLSDLLEERPVLLLAGSYTCPVYQASVEAINAFADEDFEGRGRIGDLIHIVHVYGTEAHPMSPDPAPHFGAVSEDAYSVLPQARSYGARRDNAAEFAGAVGEGQLLLIDDLRPHGPDNPIWSSYGSGAASGWFIRQDGTIIAAQVWIDMKTLRKAARLTLLAAEA